MILMPDVKSENEMRLRLALLNAVTNVHSGEEVAATLAAIITIVIVFIMLVCFVAAVVAIGKTLTRLPTLHRRNTAHSSAAARTLKRTLGVALAVSTLAAIVSVILSTPSLSVVVFGVTFLIVTIIYELVDAKRQRRQEDLETLLTGGPAQLSEQITLNDIISWQKTINEADAVRS